MPIVMDEDVLYCLGGKNEHHLWTDHHCKKEREQTQGLLIPKKEGIGKTALQPADAVNIGEEKHRNQLFCHAPEQRSLILPGLRAKNTLQVGRLKKSAVQN